MMGRLDIVNMAVFPKMTYRFKHIIYQNPSSLFLQK